MKEFEFSEDELLTLYFALKNYKETDIHEHAKEKVTDLLLKLGE